MAKIVKQLKFPNDSENYEVNAVALGGKEADKYALLDSPTFTGIPKAPTAATGTSTTQIATTQFVATEINSKLAANDAMIYKGTLGSGGTVTALPATHNAGWTYKVITAGTYAGYSCEIGDMLICTTDGTSANNAHWSVVQSNIDGAVTGPTSSTNGVFPLFSGTTGKVIKNSSYGPTSFAPNQHYHEQYENQNAFAHIGVVGQGTNSAQSSEDQINFSAGANVELAAMDHEIMISASDRYHSTGSWKGLTYTATNNGGAPELAFTIPTGTTSTTVSKGNHTHNYAGSSTPGGAATSAQKLTVDGGDYNTPVYFSNGVPVSCTNIDEGNLVWSGRSRAGSITPLDIAMSSLHNPNRLAFANPNGIKIEYSTNGTTFTDYPGLTDNQKVSLVSGPAFYCQIGAKTSGVTVNDKLRVTLNATAMGVYTLARKLLLNISTSGATGSHVIIETSKKGSETTFTQVGDYPIEGWSGWNSIPLNGIAFGGGDNQTTNIAVIRLTFGITGLSSTYSSALSLSDIALHGETYWATPSNLAKTGHVYSYTANQDVSFPASVTASAFNGYLVGNISGNARTADNATKDSDGNTISSYYMKRGSYERIESGKDLNNYNQAGFYNVKTQGVLNCPAGIGIDATLLVYPWNSEGYELQEITETAASGGSRRWVRHCTGATHAWTAWTKISTETTDDFEGGTETWYFNCGTSTTVLD